MSKESLIKEINRTGKILSWYEYARKHDLGNENIARKAWSKHFKDHSKFKLSKEIGSILLTPISEIIDHPNVGKTITLKSNKPLSPEEIAELAQVDGVNTKVARTWLKSHQNDTWTYSIDVKYNTLEIGCNNAFSKYLESVDIDYSKYNFPIRKSTDEFLVLSISDLHMDKKSYTNEKDNILSEAFKSALYLLRTASTMSSYKDVYLILGNDFFNDDTYYKTTTKGTPQDSEGSYDVVFFNALSFCIDLINMIQQHGKNVHVYAPKGNHDATKSQYLQAAIKKIFEKSKNISINLDCKDRQYFSRGENVFMLTHGDNMTHNKLPLVFATEMSKDWSKKFKTIITGHTHKKAETQFLSTNEEYGIDIKVCPSLSKTDKWHYENGYIGNKRRSIAYLYSDTDGEIATLNSKCV